MRKMRLVGVMDEEDEISGSDGWLKMRLVGVMDEEDEIIRSDGQG